MESLEAVSSPSLEVALRSAGPAGLTVVELMEATGKPETTVRRLVGALIAEDKAYKQPTLDGVKIVFGDKPAKPAPPVNARRKDAADRDAQVLDALQVNGRISLNELARVLDMPDIDNKGWSQLTYLSLRRLQNRGLVDREIVWVHQPDPSKPKDP